MSMTDPVSDMLTRIRNAQNAMHKAVSIPASKIKLAIAKVLKEEGYITDYKVEKLENRANLVVTLKYFEGKKVIEMLKRVSMPGCRVYRPYTKLPLVMGGYGVAIVSTPQGVMTDKAARSARLGGEVLCEIA